MDVDREIDDILVRAGEALANGAMDVARDGLRRAEEIDALDRDVLLFRAALHLQAGEEDVARAAVEAVVEHHGDDPVALASAAGMVLDLDNDPEAALPLAEEADALLEEIEIDPEDRDAARDMRIEVLTLISDCRLATGDTEGAKEAAATATQLGPDHSRAWAAAGRAAFALARLPEARSALTTALTLDAEDAEAAWNLGWLERLAGDDAAAATAFAQAARLAPEDFPAPVDFAVEWLKELVRDVAIAFDAPLDELLRDVPIVVDDLPPVEPDGDRPPTALLWLEGPPPHDRAEDDRLRVKPERIRVFRRNVEVAAHDADSACAVVEAALGAEMGMYLDFEGGDDDGELLPS